MTAGERDELRRRIDRAVRRRVKGRCEDGWTNPETGYRRGCRCDFCTVGTADARRARKSRRRRRLEGAAA
jgi:hypothetical protein